MPQLLESNDVRLRELRVTDLEQLFTWINDRELVQLNAPFRPISTTEHRQWFEGVLQQRDDRLFFMIEERSTSTTIGSCQLLDIDRQSRSCELQIRIGESTYHGRGLGTQAVELLCLHAFTNLGLHRVQLHVFATNARAIRAYRKAGFIEEGRRRDAAFIDDEYVDVVVMGRLHDDQ